LANFVTLDNLEAQGLAGQPDVGPRLSILQNPVPFFRVSSPIYIRTRGKGKGWWGGGLGEGGLRVGCIVGLGTGFVPSG
jgi:hypothetical protein